MSIQYKNLTKLFDAKQWIKDGWQMFKKNPIVWVMMLLFFDIFLIVGSTHYIARYISTLLLPILTGGIYHAAHNSQQGKIVSVINLFSMFESPRRKTLKELLIIGGVGVIVALISGSLIGFILLVLWSFILLFAVPLVVINNQQAIPAIKSALLASVSNLIPILIFYFLSLILLIVTTAAGAIGLFIVIPVLFGASYSAYRMIFLKIQPVDQEEIPPQVASKLIPAQAIAATVVDDADIEEELSLEEKAANRMRGELDTDGNIVLPKGFEIKYHDEYMHITRRWRNVGPIIFSTFIMLFIGGIFIVEGWGAWTDLSGIEIAVPLFFGIPLYVSLYSVIAYWFNKTQIYVSQNAIEIKHEPIPWRGNKRVETEDIKQLYVQQYRLNKGSLYKVTALTHGEEEFDLIKSLPKSQDAFYIEQKVEKYLGIKDVVNLDELGYGFLKKDG